MKKTILSLLVGLTMASQAFADDLYQVYQQAQEKDPTINRAKAERDAAYEGISISRANLLPRISGAISYTDSSRESNQQISGPTDEDPNAPVIFATFDQDATTLGAGIDFSMSLYDRQNWVALSRAEKIAQQSDADYALAKQNLIVRTTEAYLAVLRAMDNLEFVRAEKRAIERQLEQTKQRFEVGLTAITDVHEAQANFDNTLAQEIVAENAVELRLEQLREITGKYHDGIYVLDTDSFSTSRPQPDQVEGWLEIAEQQSLELLVQKIAVEIAKEDIESARAGHYPTLSLGASYDRSDSDVNGRDFPATDSNSIGVTLNIPFYEGGRVSAQTAQARYLYVAASENLELAHRSTIRSVRSSFNDVIAAISTIRALEQAVVSAESALQATDAGFDVGTRTIVDVLNSTRNLFDARRNLAGARYDFIESVLTLKGAAGNLTEQAIVDISRGLRTPSAD